jgi:hypothetical protein
MSKQDILLKRLLSRPKNFTYKELRTLLNGLGYAEVNKGKTSSSSIVFIHGSMQHIIRLHKPHPGNGLKLYQVDQVIDTLKNQEVI